MSSLRKSSRVRPKSPPLQPPSATLATSNVKTAVEHRICRLVRIGKHVSGISKCPVSAPTATAARGRTLFRSASAAGFVGLALDPDDGKDQDGPHAFA